MNNLTANHTCASHDFSCANGKECIAMEWRCDRDYDCGDMSDEHGCEPGKVKSIHLPLGCCASCWEKLRFFKFFYPTMISTYLFFLCDGSFTPLTPKSDQHLNSPYNITPESHIQVRRIKEVIPNLRLSIIKLILLASTLGNVKSKVQRICILMSGCNGLWWPNQTMRHSEQSLS